MLSYQHGFHAGNFADLHKHLVLTTLLEALNRKTKPWSYLETHSGRALYDLADAQAQKTGEYRQGIARLWQQEWPAPLQTYLQQVKRVNSGEALTHYPGSPTIAAGMARADDRIRLMELHPAEVEALRQVFERDERVAVHHRDGYEGVGALLPPTPRRGLVLIDPAYEVKEEYAQVVRFLSKAQRRWPTGIFAIWYPLLAANRWRTLIDGIKAGVGGAVLRSELQVAPTDSGGMYGSGMLVVNPPWQLDQQLQLALPLLAQALGCDAVKAVRNEWLVAEQ
ncbi:23S rRNA (adenine(2030)-N(6))-methyltransferase RlmJ [Marinobacterium sp. D7]|uniref:23S rRNA (adenine(2030)-N(6))-methyltransferase RlmJ n=1 Tax=Marinobacterium ramblicola TaxID=2849041 RepID=UPI001C2CF99B|nr:23S rRNA (adenine(2030)-N(6))-methyltransferase RlmJ [Marinobacterium ramblicola]MBV1790294.1 23S rRNA (adenine(2030)-N(6))-methyltransferase RlmJ [Marinobacterium ramblicola]